MRRKLWSLSNSHPPMAVVIAGLVGVIGGIFLTGATRSTPARADDAKAAHGKSPSGVKAPIEEILHCQGQRA